jgi:hypothetical protein
MMNQFNRDNSDPRFTRRSAMLLAAACGASLLASALPRALRAAEEKANESGGEVVLFNGKDLSGWKTEDPKRIDHWKAVSNVKLDEKDPHKLDGEGDGGSADGVLFLPKPEGGCDIYTEQAFGDVELHIEFNIPKGSNSGVYLMGQYECQVLDSFGKPDDKLGVHDCAAVYTFSKPKVNACKAPGEWQTYDITFRAPRFDSSGKKVENAKYVKVVQNGKTVQEDVEVPHSTGGQLPGGEKPKGPLMLQGNHGPCAFRNIRVKPVELK